MVDLQLSDPPCLVMLGKSGVVKLAGFMISYIFLFFQVSSQFFPHMALLATNSFLLVVLVIHYIQVV